jgi:hypothetical protein
MVSQVRSNFPAKSLGTKINLHLLNKGQISHSKALRPTPFQDVIFVVESLFYPTDADSNSYLNQKT